MNPGVVRSRHLALAISVALWPALTPDPDGLAANSSAAAAATAAGAPSSGTVPDCARAFAQPMVLWPADRTLTDVAIQGLAGASGVEPRIEILSVRQNEPPQAAGEEGGKRPNASPCPDAVAKSGKLQLRAERRQDRNGRIYAVEFRATHGTGGSCTGTVAVRVPIEKGRKDGSQPDLEEATFDATTCE